MTLFIPLRFVPTMAGMNYSEGKFQNRAASKKMSNARDKNIGTVGAWK